MEVGVHAAAWKGPFPDQASARRAVFAATRHWKTSIPRSIHKVVGNMNGKGSKRRPTQVSEEEFQANWDLAFGGSGRKPNENQGHSVSFTILDELSDAPPEGVDIRPRIGRKTD